MVTRGLRSAISAYIRRRPGSTAQVAAQIALGTAHEGDFELFAQLRDQAGLVLDIGAHRGQSAVSILSRTRRLRVVSLEPNPACRPALLMVFCRYPRRFRFHITAAGRQAGRATLWLPGAPRSGLSTQATLKPAEFDKAVVRERLAAAGVDVAQRARFRRRSVRVLRADQLDLAPDVIKIDVEGSEAEVLEGLAACLDRLRPALLIERNEPARWLPGLIARGYRCYRFQQESGRLVAHDPEQGVLNLLCLHPDSASPLNGALRALLAQPQGGPGA